MDSWRRHIQLFRYPFDEATEYLGAGFSERSVIKTRKGGEMDRRLTSIAEEEIRVPGK